MRSMFINYSIQQVSKDLEIKAYYAGHVLGAAMFQVKVGDQSIVYTVRERERICTLLSWYLAWPLFQGDYNMTPDRHLGCVNVL